LIVLDASAAIDWLLHTPDGYRIERRIASRGEKLHAPHLIDLEIIHALRRLSRDGTIVPPRADQAVSFLQALPITRHGHTDLLRRVWRHRHSLSAYDAAYVALAEALGAALITRDSRLAASHGHSAKIELF
jgi:predicted nucleic acid-binding protein